MKRWIKIAAAVAGAIAATLMGATAVGNVLWTRATKRTLGKFTASRTPSRDSAVTFSPEHLAGLPDPVIRYFTFALTPGQPLIRGARLEQRGEFLTRPGGAWSPFTAVEHFIVHRPGFLWDAAIRMAPLFTARVRDSYLDGQGRTHGRLAGLVTVVDQGGTPEMTAASLQRYLAEAAWLPPALFPSAGVTWTAIDESTARATLADHGITVSVDFRFGSRGEIVGISAKRYRAVAGRQVLTPWVGRFWSYERVDGMMIPRDGEVAWVLPDGPFPYWRGRITHFAYDRVKPDARTPSDCVRR